MRFSTFVLSAAALLAASTLSAPIRRDVDPSLVPEFGVEPGVNPTGTGDCDGVNGPNGQPIKIPCACPPPRDEFLQSLNANVAAGQVINNPSVKLSFPTDNSQASRLARLNAATVTIQNLHGPGVGCPVAATTFAAQREAIEKDADGAATPAPAASPANNAAGGDSPANNGAPSPDDVARLAPDLGFQSGVNPTGTGDCDGAVKDANGNPIKVPCSCPPPQDVYIQALQTNVAAGKAVNNPSVAVTFPTGASKQDQAARIEAALVTLQNINGPGKGCPAASTTLVAQRNALGL